MDALSMRALVDRYLSGYNRMNLDDMLAPLHADVVFANIAGGVVNASANGICELKALAEASLPLFSERHQEITSFEVTDQHAAACIAFRAVVACDLPNGLRAGQALQLSGRTEFSFRDGAIVNITDIS